jgi:hypothetical protein
MSRPSGTLDGACQPSQIGLGGLIHCDTLFESGVVEFSGLGEQSVKSLGLLSIGTQSIFVGLDHLGPRCLCLPVLIDRFFGNPSNASKCRYPGAQVGQLVVEDAGCAALAWVSDPLRCFGWVSRNKQVYVVRNDFECLDHNPALCCFFRKPCARSFSGMIREHMHAVLWTADQVILEGAYASRVCCVSAINHRTIALINCIAVNYNDPSRRSMAYDISKFLCRRKTTVPFGVFYGMHHFFNTFKIKLM